MVQFASLFDVSHMCQLRWKGRDRIKFLERMTVADLQTLPEGHGKLSVITNEEGGIIDDTVITNRFGFFLCVSINSISLKEEITSTW